MVMHTRGEDQASETRVCRGPPRPPHRPPGLQMGEIPPNSTINIDVELLSIKTNPLGYQVKLVEG